MIQAGSAQDRVAPPPLSGPTARGPAVLLWPRVSLLSRPGPPRSDGGQPLRVDLQRRLGIAAQGFGNPRMKRAARVAEQCAVSRVLHQSVIEQISRVRRQALPEQQFCT